MMGGSKTSWLVLAQHLHIIVMSAEGILSEQANR